MEDGQVKIRNDLVPNCYNFRYFFNWKFRYLDAIVEPIGGLHLYTMSRMRVGWAKYGESSGVLFDMRVECQLKDRFYKVVLDTQCFMEQIIGWWG